MICSGMLLFEAGYEMLILKNRGVFWVDWGACLGTCWGVCWISGYLFFGFVIGPLALGGFIRGLHLELKVRLLPWVVCFLYLEVY